MAELETGKFIDGSGVAEIAKLVKREVVELYNNQFGDVASEDIVPVIKGGTGSDKALTKQEIDDMWQTALEEAEEKGERVVQIKNGGTGASDAVAARAALEGAETLYDNREYTLNLMASDSSIVDIVLSNSVLNFETIFLVFRPHKYDSSATSTSYNKIGERFTFTTTHEDIRAQIEATNEPTVGSIWGWKRIITMHDGGNDVISSEVHFSNDGKHIYFNIRSKQGSNWNRVYLAGVYGVGRIR